MALAQTDSQFANVTDRDPDEAAALPILLAVLGLLVAWGVSIALWGIPGLYIPALAMVPVIWVALLVISRG
jgi:fatty acid desaturase